MTEPISPQETSTISHYMRDSTRSKSSFIQECVDELLDHPGKFLRPSLVVLSAKIVVSARTNAETALILKDASVYKIAAAVELLHMATLVHDDIIDKAATRRSRPTVFAKKGARTAVLLGDHLSISAFQLVADLADSRSASLLARTVRSISEGEMLQMKLMSPSRPAFRQYLHQIFGKTAALFAASCRAGAEQAAGTLAEIQTLQRVGYNTGMAFQMVDDILDFDDSDKTSGKTPGRDLELGLLTLPVLCALKEEASNSLEKAFRLQKTLKSLQGNGRKFHKVKSLVQELNGFEHARKWVCSHSERALRELTKLPESPSRALLVGLVNDLTTRIA